ncbi:MAG TPA: transcription antitermination factor NusB [Spirochaetota bacterium]|nr:transcription antitermination factor NusB [Spirochaetota bacterium]HPF05375.1 transcription antitermination factor NusB [Spirochaetota bacterium]HPJ41804.1 transcription antitermination factor NusB [Spirochaetota bacterium]HPR38096.1 transcription antitermination factor NusB [Spirochaetota bacterium]HRX46956.1 transcription antitermination factor NusB [Spirochaetota bacterium]
MGHRRKARETALQGLYMHEVGKADIDTITRFDWLEETLSEEIRKFAVTIITGVVSNIEKIDSLISAYSKNWKPERLTVIDKSILRLAIFEMLFIEDIPTVVTINESIELGKTFGGENSGQFINGILDAVKKNELKEK